MNKIVYLVSLLGILLLNSCGTSEEKKAMEDSSKNQKSEQPETPKDPRIKCDDVDGAEELTDNFSGVLKTCKDGYIVSVVEYEKGVISGCSKSYYDNGQLKSESYYKRETGNNEMGEEFSYSQPIFDSISRLWYPNGNLQLLDDKKGKSQILYYETGQKKKVITFHSPGGMVKKTECYDENGNTVDCSSID